MSYFLFLAVTVFLFIAVRFVWYGNVGGIITGCEYVTKKVSIPAELKNVELTLGEPAYLITGPHGSDCASRKSTVGRMIDYNYYHNGTTGYARYHQGRGQTFSLYEGSNTFTIESIVYEYNTGLLTAIGPMPVLILADEKGDLYEFSIYYLTSSSDHITSGQVILKYQTPEGETDVLSLEYFEEKFGL